MTGCGQSLDHEVAFGQGSGTVQRRKGEEKKREEGGEGKRKGIDLYYESESIVQK